MSGMLPGSRSVTSAFTFMKPDRHVDARAAHAERLLQPLPELVPRDHVRPAELERPVRRLGLVDRGREVRADVVDPDRLDALLPSR